MTSQPYLTSPPPSDKLPPGIPYIVGNEAAERFSFYGMRGILVIYMTKYLYDAAGNADFMTKEEAKSYYHLFMSSAYFFPIFGAILSDWLLGKYRTILSLSIVYCIGHLALAALPGRLGLIAGLILIAVGSGGIKPCVSAHVGDQFGEKNQHLLERVFGWFYLSINLGALISSLLTPWLLESEWMIKRFGEKHTHQIAFGVPGVLMMLATIVFWSGRHKFVHVPAGGMQFFRQMFGKDGLAALVRLIPLYLFVAVFWSLYDQTGSSWVIQAEDMDRRILWLTFPEKFPYIGVGNVEVSAAALQAINPFLILLYVPLFSYVIYPLAGPMLRTPLRRIGTGFVLIAASFLICGWLQTKIVEQFPDAIKQYDRNRDDQLSQDELPNNPVRRSFAEADRDQNGVLPKVEYEEFHQKIADQTPSAYWQIVAYMVLTAAEVLVSVTCLEFSYTQAPPRMKSMVMALNLFSVSLGNFLTSGVNTIIQRDDMRDALAGARYYWFFAGVMFAAAAIFVPFSLTFRQKNYLPDGTVASY